MSTERDITRIVRSWLATDEHESADRVLGNVFAVLDATPQRRPWWPARRIADMNTYAKLGIAIAAVVVLAVAGFSLLPASGGVGGGPASPSPVPTATSTPAPTPSPSATPTPAPSDTAVFPPAGPLAAGRHRFVVNDVPFSLELANDTWHSNGEWGLDNGTGVTPEGAAFILWQDPPIGVFSDPCTSTQGEPAGSLDELMAAVASIPGTDLVSGPEDVTVGGYPAKRVTITIQDDIGCRPDAFYLWYGTGSGNARYATQAGGTMWSWAIDVDGQIVWIDGETYKDAGPGPGQEVESIIDSIQFE